MGIDVARTGIDVEALKNRFYPGPDHRHQQGDARVATETDAARDRVLAARAALGEELETLEASARSAVDVPAKIRRSPGKAAAVAGGTAFVVLGGPQARLPRAASARSRARPTPLPESMLPEEIEKALRELGDDGDEGPRHARARLRGLRQAGPARPRQRPDAAAPDRRPAAPVGATKAAAKWLFRTDDEGFQARLAADPRPRLARVA